MLCRTVLERGVTFRSANHSERSVASQSVIERGVVSRAITERGMTLEFVLERGVVSEYVSPSERGMAYESQSQ